VNAAGEIGLGAGEVEGDLSPTAMRGASRVSTLHGHLVGKGQSIRALLLCVLDGQYLNRKGCKQRTIDGDPLEAPGSCCERHAEFAKHLA
jgi:hypothetical protein